MGKIFALMLVIFLVMPSSENTEATETKSRSKRRKGRTKTTKLIKETFSNGDLSKCQIFRLWNLNGQRIGCCTDDRSIPLTLCVDKQGNEVENNTKITDHKCPNPWECARRSN